VRRVWWWSGVTLALAAAITGCQERLTSPADCPALCPGGTQQLADTVVFTAAPGGDSTFGLPSGYVGRGGGRAILVSNGLPASEDRAVYRFDVRTDSIRVRDTLRKYDVDSVTLSLSIVARDTLVNGLQLQLYRLPPTVDSTATFADIEAAMTPDQLIQAIAVPDSVNTGLVTTTLKDEAALATVRLPPGGDSVLAVGVRILADAPTGVRLGSLIGGNAATFTSYVTVDVPDTTAVRKQSMVRGTNLNTFVTQSPLVPADTLLTVGGEPSSRSLLRFDLPPALLDSAFVVRATLELIPATPILGLATDVATIQAVAVVSDLGAKSLLISDSDTRFIVTDTLAPVQSDTVRLEVTNLVQLWQASRERPQSIFLRLGPAYEAASFSRAVFGSTRSPSVGAPRLRITYQRSFPFETP
jgi:hypothetical protein